MPCGGAAAMAASDPTLEAKLIPDWVKNNAGWWATDQIEDADFINGIEYLIKKDILGIDNKKIKGKVPIEDVIFSPLGLLIKMDWFLLRHLSLRFMVKMEIV